MLSVNRIQNRDYLVNLAQEDYYEIGGEPPGKWHGNGATFLGLNHLVRREELHQLMDGYHPLVPGKKLVQNAGRYKREIGWDFTFSAPKSVSVIWSQASPNMRKAIEQTQESSVRKTLNFLEEQTTTRRGKGGSIREPAKLVTAIFEHGTSRELDPNLHSHTVVLNLGIRPSDNTSGAIQINDLLTYKMLAGALYRAELGRQLCKNLGFKIGTHQGSKPELWDIKGVDESLIDTFSKRRKQIQEQLQHKGLKSAVAASIAALDTRIEKKNINRKELFSVWQGIGRSFHYRPPAPKFTQQDVEAAKDTLGQEGIESLLEEGSSFTQDELMRFISERAPQAGLGIDDIKDATQRALMRKGLVYLGDLGNGDRYTTQTIHRQAKDALSRLGIDKPSKKIQVPLQPEKEPQLHLHL